MWTHGYLFYTLGYNPFFFPQSVPALALGISFSWLLSPLWPTPIMVGVYEHSYFLALQNAPLEHLLLSLIQFRGQMTVAMA